MIISYLNEFKEGMMATLTPDWSDSMAGAGSGITNTMVNKLSAIATCNGYAFQYDFALGGDPIRNDLTGIGKGEVRIAYDSDRKIVYFGCNGHIQAVMFNSFSTCVWSTPITLTNAVDTVTSVLVSRMGYIYAGANGYVYKINADGQELYSNPMTGTGNNEVRLALSPDEKKLFVGTNGQVLALSADDMKEQWRLTLPGWDWHGSTSNTVSVLSSLYQDPTNSGRNWPWLYIGCNGWIYSIDLTAATPQVTAMTQSLQANLGAGDTRLAYDSANSLLYVGLSGCAACLDASLRQPAKWTYEYFKSPGRVANVTFGPVQVFLGTNGQVALIEGGKCKSNGPVPNGGTNPVSLSVGPISYDPATPDYATSVRLMAGVNGYVSSYLVGTP